MNAHCTQHEASITAEGSEYATRLLPLAPF
jgi:hypothetical protein